MGSVCIVTDNSAQFTSPGFLNNQGLKVLNNRVTFVSNTGNTNPAVKVSDFPRYISSNFFPKIDSPSEEEVAACLEKNLAQFDDVFIIFLSKEISPLFGYAEKICATLHGHANLHLIDSMNTSIGLGLIVQYALELVDKKLVPAEIEKALRLVIPHVYTLLSTPNLSYLHAAGMLDKGQATIGEMLSLSPLFLIEDGILNPLQKVKNQRSVVDFFMEFIDEFDRVKHVAVIQPAHASISETRQLRQHIDDCYPTAQYSEYPINPFLASLIGPRGFGIVVMEEI
jgi:DegV family protein with EDD domain